MKKNYIIYKIILKNDTFNSFFIQRKLRLSKNKLVKNTSLVYIRQILNELNKFNYIYLHSKKGIKKDYKVNFYKKNINNFKKIIC